MRPSEYVTGDLHDPQALRPHYVYELWAGDTCLYVGMTANLKSRIGDHRRKPWGSQITEVRSVERPTRGAAKALEAQRIFILRPKRNLDGNPDNRSWLIGHPHYAKWAAENLDPAAPLA